MEEQQRQTPVGRGYCLETHGPRSGILDVEMVWCGVCEDVDGAAAKVTVTWTMNGG